MKRVEGSTEVPRRPFVRQRSTALVRPPRGRAQSYPVTAGSIMRRDPESSRRQANQSVRGRTMTAFAGSVRPLREAFSPPFSPLSHRQRPHPGRQEQLAGREGGSMARAAREASRAVYRFSRRS